MFFELYFYFFFSHDIFYGFPHAEFLILKLFPYFCNSLRGQKFQNTAIELLKKDNMGYMLGWIKLEEGGGGVDWVARHPLLRRPKKYNK